VKKYELNWLGRTLLLPIERLLWPASRFSDFMVGNTYRGRLFFCYVTRFIHLTHRLFWTRIITLLVALCLFSGCTTAYVRPVGSEADRDESSKAKTISEAEVGLVVMLALVTVAGGFLIAGLAGANGGVNALQDQR